MSAVSSTLQGANDLVLWKVIHELVHVEIEFSWDKTISINGDPVVCSDPVLQWAMVSVKIVAFCDKAAGRSTLFTSKSTSCPYSDTRSIM